MTDLDLNELDRLEKAATPGPWKWDSDQIKDDPMNRCRYRVCVVGKTVMQTYYSSDDRHAEADIALTCAIRNALPDLLAILRTAEAHADELESALRDLLDFARRRIHSSYVPPQGQRAINLLAAIDAARGKP